MLVSLWSRSMQRKCDLREERIICVVWGFSGAFMSKVDLDFCPANSVPGSTRFCSHLLLSSSQNYTQTKTCSILSVSLAQTLSANHKYKDRNGKKASIFHKYDDALGDRVGQTRSEG